MNSEADTKPKIRIERMDGEDVSLMSDRSLIFKVYYLVKNQTSAIKGFVILTALMSLASMIMLIVLLSKINDYGC
ncbi:MAG: hypothetical protein ACTSQF_16120 [Candidatus Heimdallarchaeaceae archaeon]